MTTPANDVTSADPIRVLLVDDQALLRESFKKLIELVDGSVVVADTAADGFEAIAAIERLHAQSSPPHVVLMDVRMPRLNGVEATRLIVARWPGVRVVILSTFDDEEYVIEGLRAGACGYLLKDTSSDDLVRAIRAAHRGQAPIQPEVAMKLLAHLTRPETAATPNPQAPSPAAGSSGPTAHPANGIPVEDLTEREREILRLLATGLSNAELAQQLFLSETTVKTHVSSILRKLNVRDRVQAVIAAYDSGLVTPG